MKRRGSFGMASGLLTACIVTLIGLAVGLEPYVILWRAAVSAFLIGAIVSFGMSVIYVANTGKS
jgi:uncharacterized membrane protein YccC